MTITEEMLYAAAPEAAERFLDTLPDREGCQVSFSAAFEGEMDRLLHRRRRRPWRGLLLAAAVLGALTVGLSVGAGSQPGCQIYWSESDGVLQYSVRMEQESTRPFALAELEAGGRAAILIPSPNVAENHQYYNALEPQHFPAPGVRPGV